MTLLLLLQPILKIPSLVGGHEVAGASGLCHYMGGTGGGGGGGGGGSGGMLDPERERK